MTNLGSMMASLGVDTRGLSKAQRQFKTFGKHSVSVLTKVKQEVFSLKMAIGSMAGAYGVGRLTTSFLTAARTTENYRLRLDALLGSTEQGRRAFEDMAKFAAKVPFEYNEIMGAATQLAGVMKGGVDEINQWMPLIADLAAVSGLSIQDTTGQVIRMYSAGAAAADMFRERGILAMLGFKAGVSYTAEETRKKMMEAWTKADSQFRGLTGEMAKTWDGLMSMISDKWFQLRSMIMEAGIYDELKKQLELVNERFGAWIKDNEALIKQKIPEYIDDVKRALQDLKGALDDIKPYLNFMTEHWEILVGLMVGAKFGPTGALAGVAIGAWADAMRSVKDLIEDIQKDSESLGITLPKAFSYERVKIIDEAIASLNARLNTLQQQLKNMSFKDRLVRGTTKITSEIEKTKKKIRELQQERVAALQWLRARTPRIEAEMTGKELAGFDPEEIIRSYQRVQKIIEKPIDLTGLGKQIGEMLEQINLNAIGYAATIEKIDDYELAGHKKVLVDLSGLGETIQKNALEAKSVTSKVFEGIKDGIKDNIAQWTDWADASKQITTDYLYSLRSGFSDTLYYGIRGDWEELKDASGIVFWTAC